MNNIVLIGQVCELGYIAIGQQSSAQGRRSVWWIGESESVECDWQRHRRAAPLPTATNSQRSTCRAQSYRSAIRHRC